MDLMGFQLISLNEDLKKLEAQDLLQGRDALVSLARGLAKQIDTQFASNRGPTAQVIQRYHEVLKSLGIGKTTQEVESDAFEALLKEMQSATDDK